MRIRTSVFGVHRPIGLTSRTVFRTGYHPELFINNLLHIDFY